MRIKGRPRRVFVLALLAACGAGASASTNTSMMPSREPSAPDDPGGTAPPEAAGDDPEQHGQHATCLARARRSFVGFSQGMSLEDFDLAAREAENVMALTERALCQQASALEPSGRLAADLGAHRLVLFEVLFVRDDASVANVGLRRTDAPEGDVRGAYRVAAERSAEQGWQLVGVALP